MKAVIIKLNHQKAIDELGQAQLDNMYYKIDRIYAGVWNMKKVDNKTFPFPDEEAVIYCGDLEYQELVGASIGIKKYFTWLKRYAVIWNLYDSSDGEMEDLIEGLFHSEL